MLACGVLFCSILPVHLEASGWNDFTLSIDPNYQIVRCNSFDIGLSDASGLVIYSPRAGDKTGPVTGYVVTDTYVFLRTTGQTPRNAFPGDEYVDADLSQEFFFIVDKSNNDLRGPLTLKDFSDDPIASSVAHVEWVLPENPHPERARAGQMMFLAFSVVLFAVPLALIAFMIYCVASLIRPKRGSTASECQLDNSVPNITE